ncbi:hypothetical protein [Fibrobacter intestinalis]|nr:hypothetical protein [Fibrobacter sp. NR9]
MLRLVSATDLKNDIARRDTTKQSLFAKRMVSSVALPTPLRNDWMKNG